MKRFEIYLYMKGGCCFELGDTIRKLNVFLIFCLVPVLLLSVGSIQAQEIDEEVDLDITLEPQTDGRCHFTVAARVSGMDLEEISFIENSPIKSVEGDLHISSPSYGRLELEGSFNVSFSEGQISPQIEMILDLLDKEALNTGVPTGGFEGLQSFEGEHLSSILSGLQEYGLDGSPSEFFDLTINELKCTSYSWDKPQLSAGFMADLSGSIFENERLREELPVNIDLSLDISETAISLAVDAESSSSMVELDLISDTTQTTELTLDGYTELPYNEDMVRWDLGIPETEPILSSEYFENLGDQLDGVNVDFVLKVPSGASVSGLPSGSQNVDHTYTWTGEDAENAIKSVAKGQANSEIVYERETSSQLPLVWIVLGVVVITTSIGLTFKLR